LAPRFFDEAKSLLSAGLLIVPQTVDFFQATLILGMWSTTIGQVPMSVDSWLMSGFALQQALAAGEVFRPLFGPNYPNGLNKMDLDRMYIYNHLCLLHLQ
jgi:hypothetical protein